MINTYSNGVSGWFVILHYFATLALLLICFHLGLMEAVLHKLSLSQSDISYAMLLAILLSLVNIQLFRLKVTSVINSNAIKDAPDNDVVDAEQQVSIDRADMNERICYGVNIGGCILPIIFSLYLFRESAPDPYSALFLVIVVSAVVYPLSRVEGKRGLVINLFGAIVSSAIGGVLLGGDDYLAWAYMAAVLGTLIGGDLLHVVQLSRVRRSWRQGIFVGGAGLMDAIFLSGLFAMMAAEMVHDNEIFRVADQSAVLQYQQPKQVGWAFSENDINRSRNNPGIRNHHRKRNRTLVKENTSLSRINIEWIQNSMMDRINIDGPKQQTIRTGSPSGVSQPLS
ncbi:DUF1614 domain-containing protein [Motiliproteus sp. MSK22-1]|uniref:DUF1614 domain-containing protein n=1 Tax=Motiliproteus sp. MSK22-1 TaxID=1897630 RepID=UPI0009789352|nr:DUF1614 domain-containing protein [Motiliproteus sp. MSK22-1]OMH25266.1 hypothetical protein BGP75_26060 [Motiliproteus sp. MSK22-1]